MWLDLLNQESQTRSSDQNQSQLINMYLEKYPVEKKLKGEIDFKKGEYSVVAYPTFGLSIFSNTLQANVRALYEHNDVVYAVAGNKFYSITSAGTATLRGTLNTSSGFAKIACIAGGGNINAQLIIIDGTNGYYYNINTSTAIFPITDVDFPQTATDITATDDYIIVLQADSLTAYYSATSDGSNWAALDFFSKIRKADKVVALVAGKGELWLLGQKTTEAFINTGDPTGPFVSRTDVFIEMGCAAKQSVLIAANKLFYLAKSMVGGYGFVYLAGQEPIGIGTSAINYQINQLTSISDCIGYAYAKDGHEFIDWVFPTDNVTFTFDIGTEVWAKRQSLVNSVYGRFLGNCHCFAFGKSLIGDYNSGIIYTQVNSVFTENSVAIRRRFLSPPVYLEGKRIFISRLQIDVQTNVGSSKTFLLELSTDRGTTWETVDTYTVPVAGSGSIYTGSLGSAFCFLFRITTTDNFNFMLLGLQAEISVGVH